MARGGVKSFDALAAAVGDDSPVDGDRYAAASSSRPNLSLFRTASLADLSTNPYNSRDSLGDLDELASIAEHQLQPAVVVTRSAFVRIYPDAEVSTKWVVVLGNRRLAAAHKFGRSDLNIVVMDELARDRSTLKAAIIAENVDRSGFDVIEEAKAVEDLVHELGSADAAAEVLRKSKTWVSHRRALLKLAPELQEATRRGDLAIREARTLARVPLEDQVARWNAARERRNDPQPDQGSGGPPAPDKDREVRSARAVTHALRRFDSEPAALATALRDHLGDTGAAALLKQLSSLLK